MVRSVSIAPYGAWDSPVSPELITRQSAVLSEVAPAPAQRTIFYTESRPSERGRSALVSVGVPGAECPAADCLEAADISVRSAVHEYGGGALAVLADGRPICALTHDTGCSVATYGGGGLQPWLPRSESVRYADFGPHPIDASMALAVEEEHEPRAVHNRLVCLERRGGAHATVYRLCAGDDFYAYPRFSPDGRLLAWVSWNHPAMPFWHAQLWVAGLLREHGRVRITAPRMVAGTAAGLPNDGVVAQQPVWVPSTGIPTLVYTQSSADASTLKEARIEWSDDEQCPRITATSLVGGASPPNCDVQPPLWKLNTSSVVCLSERHVVCIETERATDHLLVLDRAKQTRTRVETPYTRMEQLRTLGPESSSVVLIASSAIEPPALVALDLAPVLADAPAHVLLKPTVLQRSSQSSLPAEYISTPEAISFPTRARSGADATAHALVYAPKNPQFHGPAEERPPCRIVVHGGPTGSAAPCLDLGIQYWTTRGWLVCAVNFRGSTGYGKAYMNELNGQWGVVDPEDCVAAAQYLCNDAPGDAGATKETAEPVDPLGSVSLHEHTSPDHAVRVTVARMQPACMPADVAWLGAAGLVAYALSAMTNAVFAESLHVQPLTVMTLCVGILAALRLLLRVQAESVCAFPGLGVQLETVRGLSLPGRSRYVETQRKREFVPRDTILDCFMVEAIHGWRVEDYAVLATDTAASERTPASRVQALRVIFPNLLPPRPMAVRAFKRIYQSLMSSSSATHAGPPPTSKPKSPVGTRVDRNRICISGRSSGGYTVLQALAQHPSVFCAGTAAYGICDLVHLAQFSHKFESHYLSTLLGGTLEQIPDVYRDRSPVHRARQIRSPVLLLQGDKDKIVLPEQSKQMAKAIKEAGGHVEYLEFAGEGHGFKTAEHQRAALEAEFFHVSRAIGRH